jgi:hypothetical protein
MKLIYFDESKNDLDYSQYHIGGICVDEAALGDIEAQIQKLAKVTFGTSELCSATEFHAAEIFHRKNNFKAWSNFADRLSVLERLIEILSHDAVDLIDIQVNCGKLHPTQDPGDIAFMFLCERANDFLRAQGGMGMLIGDRESDRHAARYATSLSSYRAKGTTFAFGREIHNLVDSVHFTHSHLSRFLQLADVYAWILQFQLRNKSSKDIYHKELFKVLRREEINLSPSKYKEWPK